MAKQRFQFGNEDDFERLKEIAAGEKADPRRTKLSPDLQRRLRQVTARVDRITQSGDAVDSLLQKGMVSLKSIDPDKVENDVLAMSEDLKQQVAGHLGIDISKVSRIQSLFDVLRNQPLAQVTSFVESPDWAFTGEPQKIREGFRSAFLNSDELSRAFFVTMSDGSHHWMLQKNGHELLDLGHSIRPFEGTPAEMIAPRVFSFKPGKLSATVRQLIGHEVDPHRFYAQVDRWLSRAYPDYNRVNYDVSLMNIGIPGVSGPILQVVQYPGKDREQTMYFSLAQVIKSLNITS